MQQAKVYGPSEIVVIKNGELLELKEWAKTRTKLGDLYCLVVIEDSSVALLLDKQGRWEHVDTKHLWRKGKFDSTIQASL